MTAGISTLKVAIVHEWLEHYAGSERVVGELLAVFPQAQVFSIVDFLPKKERAFLGGRKVTTTFIQKLPFARKHFRNYLGLMPLAVEQFDRSVSVSSRRVAEVMSRPCAGAASTAANGRVGSSQC